VKTFIATMAALAVVFGPQDSASAQAPTFGRSNRPTTSPYLNLLPFRNQSPALNYYRSYRPEVEFRNNFQQVGRSINGLQREIDQTRLQEQKDISLLGITGHSAVFHNTSSYFPGWR
jgi:hypothetical protein